MNFRLLGDFSGTSCRRWHMYGALLLVLVFGAVVFLPLAMGSVTGMEGGHADHGVHSGGAMPMGQWEGSPQGIAYSEFNHALSGLAVILIGLTELRTGLGVRTLAWARFLLPVGMLGFGAYLLIWSDHEAWPIGTMSLAETMLGGDWEIIQHKLLALALLSIGTIELLGRTGYFRRYSWEMALPGFAILAGGMLFLHRHGPHPAAHQIMIHHSVMGTLAIVAGSCRVASAWLGAQERWSATGRSPLLITWAVLILVIGVQLLLYSET